jgi:hypothetical protein
MRAFARCVVALALAPPLFALLLVTTERKQSRGCGDGIGAVRTIDDVVDSRCTVYSGCAIDPTGLGDRVLLISRAAGDTDQLSRAGRATGTGDGAVSEPYAQRVTL